MLRGTLAGKATTHDVTVAWELGHQYLTLRERARELDAQGRSQYEALVLLGWDAATQEYQCLWLDTTGGGGLAPQSIGVGKRSGKAIPLSRVTLTPHRLAATRRGPTMWFMRVRFEWDPAKNLSNIKKHQVSFEEASTVFLDENSLLIADPDHSDEEDRFILLGLSSTLRLLIVCHCYRSTGGVIRIISAQKADRQERQDYLQRFKS